MPARWRGYLDATRGQGRGAAYRHYWELSVLYGVQAGLRSGDLWVPGSRRYTDPIHPAHSRRRRGPRSATTSAPSPAPTPTRPGSCNDSRPSYTPPWPTLERVLADPAREGLARVDDDGDLIVSPLPAEQIPAEAEALAQAIVARLPQIQSAGAADRGRPS